MALTRAAEDQEDPPDLAHWLEESARRRIRSAVRAAPQNSVTCARLLFLFGTASFAYLFYYFTGVHLEIASMHGVVVFIAAPLLPVLTLDHGG